MIFLLDHDRIYISMQEKGNKIERNQMIVEEENRIKNIEHSEIDTNTG